MDTDALLDQIDALTKLVRTTWLSLIAGCTYAWLAIATMSDADIMADDATLELPIIGTKIPPSGFLLFAPAIILLIFIYVHINLTRLWSFYKRLPSRIDGMVASDRVAPWIMTSLIQRTDGIELPFLNLGRISAVLLGWVFPPVTIAALGGRYIEPTEFQTLYHSLLLSIAVVLAVRSAWFTFRTRIGDAP